MIRFTDTLYAELQQELQQAGMEHSVLPCRAERSLITIRTILARLREFISGYTFADAQEEIRFFKDIKPRFQKELFYWTEILLVETHKPVAGKRKVRRYLNRILDGIELFFTRHHSLYTYYRCGHTDRDTQLFLRASVSEALYPEPFSDPDTVCSTPGSTLLAQIQAMEEVTVWLAGISRTAVPAPGQESHRLTWTGSKAQLIELVYALESYGVFNNGKSSVKEVMEYLQSCFNVQKVSNYYGYFQGMRIRKKDRTPFLKGLIEHTIRRMDESDEFPRFA